MKPGQPNENATYWHVDFFALNLTHSNKFADAKQNWESGSVRVSEETKSDHIISQKIKPMGSEQYPIGFKLLTAIDHAFSSR